LVVEFEYAGVRQEILVAEESDFHVITDTDRGQMRASGQLGRVSHGRVHVVLQYYFDFHDGGGSGGTFKREVPLGHFFSGSMSLPFSYFLCYVWVRCGVDPVPTLIEALDPRDLNARSAARHLGRLGPEASQAVPDLIDIVKGNDAAKLRVAAAAALGKIGPEAKDAVPVLVQQLDDEQSGDVRVAAAAALWQIATHPDAVPALLAALGDSERTVQHEALDALGELGVEAPAAGPALLPMLEESGPRLRAGAAAALWATTRDPRAVDALVAMLESDSPGRGHARTPLRSIGFPGGQPATEGVARDAFSPNSITRRAVADTLIEIDPGASLTLPFLVRTVRENEGRGREEASDVLARFGVVLLPRLRELLDTDEDSRRLACYTLWRIGTPAVETLADALRHPNVEVRRSAAAWLRNPDANTASATPNLVRALADDDEQVRIAALGALVEVGRPAIPALQYALKDPNPRTRDLAQRILREIEALEKMERRNE
jgi:HEAT repeat protein